MRARLPVEQAGCANKPDYLNLTGVSGQSQSGITQYKLSPQDYLASGSSGYTVRHFLTGMRTAGYPRCPGYCPALRCRLLCVHSSVCCGVCCGAIDSRRLYSPCNPPVPRTTVPKEHWEGNKSCGIARFCSEAAHKCTAV